MYAHTGMCTCVCNVGMVGVIFFFFRHLTGRQALSCFLLHCLNSPRNSIQGDGIEWLTSVLPKPVLFCFFNSLSYLKASPIIQKWRPFITSTNFSTAHSYDGSWEDTYWFEATVYLVMLSHEFCTLSIIWATYITDPYLVWSDILYLIQGDNNLSKKVLQCFDITPWPITVFNLFFSDGLLMFIQNFSLVHCSEAYKVFSWTLPDQIYILECWHIF